jgi:aldose 1-epimerase
MKSLLLHLIATSSLMAAEVPQAQSFGLTPEGIPVEVYTLSNSKGTKLCAMTYGAIVLSLETVDKNGQVADVILGYSTLNEYIKDSPYFGAVVGRYGNRISNGKFTEKSFGLTTLICLVK